MIVADCMQDSVGYTLDGEGPPGIGVADCMQDSVGYTHRLIEHRRREPRVGDGDVEWRVRRVITSPPAPT